MARVVCGVTPTLRELDDMEPIGPVFAWLSYGQWMVECLWTEESERLEHAWRVPPTFLASGRNSVLTGLVAYRYTESISDLNTVYMLWYGVAMRNVAYCALLGTNRSKMSRRGLTDVVRSAEQYLITRVALPAYIALFGAVS